MRSLFKAFWQEEDGAAAIEYALIAALIALGIVVAAGTLGDDLGETFGKLSTELTKATGSGS